MSRATGVDLITGDGLARAIDGVESAIDAATGPSAEEGPATESFAAAARNLKGAAEAAGVRCIVVVSLIGTDRHRGGYLSAKVAHEQAMLDGPLPVHIAH